MPCSQREYAMGRILAQEPARPVVFSLYMYRFSGGYCTNLERNSVGRKRKGKRGFGVREGDVVGHGGTVIDANAKTDKHGHRFVSVFWDHPRTCPHCHGQPKVARADKLRSGRIVSCGKVKAAAFLKHCQKQATRRAASKLPGVDSITGKPIR